MVIALVLVLFPVRYYPLCKYEIYFYILIILLVSCDKPIESILNFTLDVSEVPEFEQWGIDVQHLLIEWIPITRKILDVAEYPLEINLIIQK